VIADRTALDARIARILADAIVREIRAEMAVQTNAPAAGSAEAQQTSESGNAHDTTDRVPRAS
jgi:hypothetical protein